MSRKAITFVIWLLIANHSAFAQEIRIGVLGLFQSRQLILTAPSGTAVAVQAGDNNIVLEAGAGHAVARITDFRGELLLELGEIKFSAHEIHAASRGGTAFPICHMTFFIGASKMNESVKV